MFLARLERCSCACLPLPAAHTARFMPASAGRSTACAGEEALIGARPLRLPGLSALDIVQVRHALHHPCALHPALGGQAGERRMAHVIGAGDRGQWLAVRAATSASQCRRTRAVATP